MPNPLWQFIAKVSTLLAIVRGVDRIAMASYKLEVDQSQDFIHCIADGDLEVKDLSVIAMALFELGQVTGITCYFIDFCKAHNKANPFQTYDFVHVDLNTMDQPDVGKAALLTRQGDQSHNFLVTVMNNACYRVQTFDEKALALSWLLADKVTKEVLN